MHLPWRDVSLTPGGPLMSTSIQDVEIAELQRLAKDARVLEVGSAFGYSAIAMALAGASQVMAVDPHWAHNSLGQMKSNAIAYGVAGPVDCLVGTSREILPALSDASFDLMFIDGDHTYDGCAYDIMHGFRLVRPGGHIAVHDYGEDCCCPGVRQAVNLMIPAGPTGQHGTLFVVEVPA